MLPLKIECVLTLSSLRCGEQEFKFISDIPPWTGISCCFGTSSVGRGGRVASGELQRVAGREMQTVAGGDLQRFSS